MGRGFALNYQTTEVSYKRSVRERERNTEKGVVIKTLLYQNAHCVCVCTTMSHGNQ
jgi:hypothetical protein